MLVIVIYLQMSEFNNLAKPFYLVPETPQKNAEVDY